MASRSDENTFHCHRWGSHDTDQSFSSSSVVCNPWPEIWNLVAHGRVQILKQALRFLKGFANLPWMGSDFQIRSLTHAAVVRETFWLCAFGPAVLHGCTPLI